MKTHHLIILVFTLVCVFISACLTLLPIGKYQKVYFKVIKDFRNKPQEHFDKQIEYAKYIEENNELPKELTVQKKLNAETPKPEKTQQDQKMTPKYIRDKNNPIILQPYKSRKFLFFRFYYK